MMMKTPEQGGDTLVHAAISTEVEGKGGLYFENFYPARNSSFTQDKRNQVSFTDKLTCEMLGFEIRAWSVVEILPVVRNKSD